MVETAGPDLKAPPTICLRFGIALDLASQRTALTIVVVQRLQDGPPCRAYATVRKQRSLMGRRERNFCTRCVRARE